MRIVINIVSSIAILAVGAVLFAFYGQKPEIPKEPESTNEATLVRTAEAVEYTEPIWVTTSGEASTYRVLTVGAEVGGKIQTKPASTRGGEFVKAGTLLFEIDSLNFRLEVDRLQAELDRIDAQIENLNIDLANTKKLLELAAEDVALQQRQLARVRNLYERKATTEAELDAALRMELMSRNTYQTLVNQSSGLASQIKTKTAERGLFEAQHAKAVADVKRCQVVSPIDGRLVDDVVEQGDFVKAGDPLVHISDASHMEIRCQLEADELGWIWQQELSNRGGTSDAQLQVEDPIDFTPVPCEVVYVFDGVETVWDGELTRFEGTGLDRETRTFPCRIVVKEPEQTRLRSKGERTIGITPPTLLSGMYVDVRIPVASGRQLLAIPREGARPGGTIWSVHEGKISIQKVSVVATQDDMAVVLGMQGELHKGDRVVVSPLPAVFDGMPVSEDVAGDAVEVEVAQ
ncbi:MAG: HlyD family efflux transporter periplasmic adaptor subunit [Planctomycetaceae bacterium]